MKLIHTADWHLGQQLHNQPRDYEHGRFLDWLLDTLVQRQPDALLIAGDIFDVVNPSLGAQALLYDFLVRAHEALPQLTIVMIAGNHDSGTRIELPAPLLMRLRTHALGRIYWREDGEPNTERLLVPLTDVEGHIRAWCLALPFLRPAEVTGQRSGITDDDSDTGSQYTRGIERVHNALIRAAEARRDPGQALIAMSHAHLHGAAVSEHSERPIVIGGEESLAASVFPDSIGYVALGHLHRPQQVGDTRIRYSGSPIPMDFSERDYPHQVLEVTLSGERLEQIESIPIPRTVDMRRIGPAPLDEIVAALEALESVAPETPREQWPWLEVRVMLDAPRVDLRATIERALTGRAVRLVSITTRYPESQDQPSHPATRKVLGPRELFQHTWQRKYGAPPPDEVIKDLQSLLQEVLDDTADEASS